MHGRPRKLLTPESAEASVAKGSVLRSLQSQLLQFHHHSIYTKEALDVSAKLLETNPECYTAWNFRKFAVDHNLKQFESDPDSIKSIIDRELRVVENTLRQNFKAYGAWYHRKWILKKGHSSIDRELKILDQFQKADSRNFHAWNYRRFVAALKNISDEEELKFTTDMIDINFSNYSAWHNRSIIISHLLKEGVQGFSEKEKVLTNEYNLIHQALFTDPDDQSGWFYHLWLLDQTAKPESPLLTTSWPVHNSDLIVYVDCLDGHDLSTFATFYSRIGTFPLILYFNQAVEGVNSGTVTVKSVFNTNNDLIWRPLSTTNSNAAHAWVTELSLCEHPSKDYPVEVTVGNARGIISLSGFHYCGPSQLTFTACFHPGDGNYAEDHLFEAISWRKENFHSYENKCEESSLMNSFDQIRINSDYEIAVSKWCKEMIINEISLFRELLSEIDCKIGKLSLARLMVASHVIMSLNQTPISYKSCHFEEVLELYNDLIQLDPSHSQYYRDQYSLVLLRQVTCGREHLLRRCFHYRDPMSSRICSFVCLKLNDLSLSRIGCFERLLWIQMLDLSNNDLRSIEGMEGLQLLRCVNLSNNKINSFTALGPLKLLKHLKVLDVSHNEMGVHRIDTTRYLYSSPLSNTLGSHWNLDETVTNGVEVTKYWEALLILKGLSLIRLDIVGNAIADQGFKLLLVKLLPNLKWLDGQKVN